MRRLLWERLRQISLLLRIGFLVGLGLPGIFLFLAYLGWLIIQATTEDVVRQRVVVAHVLAAHVDAELQARIGVLQHGARRLTGAGRGADLAAARGELAALVEELGPGAAGVILLDARGQVVLAVPAPGLPPDVLTPDAAAVREALASREPVVSAAGPRAGRPWVTLAAPFPPTDGSPGGLLVGVVDPSQPDFAGLVAAARSLGETGHAEIVDQHGVVLAASEPERLLQLGEHPEFFEPLLARRLDGAGTSRSVEGAPPSWRHLPHVMAFVPLRVAPWGLTLGASEDETLAPARRWVRGLFILAAAGLFVALLLLALVARKVIAPLRALIRAAERIAGGNLDTAVPEVGVAEVASLADAFERMRRQLSASQRELAVGKSRYEGIFRAIGDPVFTVDAELRVTSINPAAERFLGCSADEALGSRCTDLLQPQDEGGRLTCALICPLSPLARPDAPPPDAHELIRTHAGQVATVATTRSAIRDEAGRVVGIVHVMRDVSAEVEANRLKDELIASVSHELRTPLGYIKGFTTTLLREDARWNAQKVRHFLEVIDAASDRLAEQIGNLLDMSRISAGALAVERGPVELPALTRNVVERLQARVGDHRFSLRWPAELPPAAGDPRRVEQVIFNLLDNALKYSPEGGEIALEAAVVGDELQVRVSDEGIGVPSSELEAIFARFHRADDPTVRRIGGSGLGLAICRGIVEAHGGRIWAQRRADRGSVFTFTLPICRAGQRSPAAEARA